VGLRRTKDHPWSWQPSRSPGNHSGETLRSLGSPKRDFLNEALVPLKADLSHRSSAETPRCIAFRLKPHELGKIAHCDARALRQNIALLLILPPRRSG